MMNKNILIVFILFYFLISCCNNVTENSIEARKNETVLIKNIPLDSNENSIDIDTSSLNKNKSDCDETLWKHVYHPQRFDIIHKCHTVTGTIAHVAPEADGDKHIRLHLDAGQENLLNEGNINHQHGDLVIEPIYVTKPKQADAINNYSGFINQIKIPKVGDHVEVTGSYVRDNQHGWMEIHPVSKIIVQ